MFGSVFAEFCTAILEETPSGPGAHRFALGKDLREMP